MTEFYSLIGIAGTLIVALVTSWLVLAPLLDDSAEALTGTAPEGSSGSKAGDMRSAIFRQLEELELDFRSGKIPTAEYQAQRAELYQQAAQQLENGDAAPRSRDT